MGVNSRVPRIRVSSEKDRPSAGMPREHACGPSIHAQGWWIAPRWKTYVASRKTTTRKSRCFCELHHHDRMLMSSCHIAFEHRYHHAFIRLKLFPKSLFYFLD